MEKMKRIISNKEKKYIFGLSQTRDQGKDVRQQTTCNGLYNLPCQPSVTLAPHKHTDLEHLPSLHRSASLNIGKKQVVVG